MKKIFFISTIFCLFFSFSKSQTYSIDDLVRLWRGSFVPDSTILKNTFDDLTAGSDTSFSLPTTSTPTVLPTYSVIVNTPSGLKYATINNEKNVVGALTYTVIGKETHRAKDDIKITCDSTVQTNADSCIMFGETVLDLSSNGKITMDAFVSQTINTNTLAITTNKTIINSGHLYLPTGATNSYVLTCTDETTGECGWLPATGGGGGGVTTVNAGANTTVSGTTTVTVGSVHNPTYTASVTTPLVVGGGSTTSSLTLKATTGVGTTNSDINFLVGNNGNNNALRILNAGLVGIGGAPVASTLYVESGLAVSNTNYAFKLWSTAGGSLVNFKTNGGVDFGGVSDGTNATSINIGTNYIRSTGILLGQDNDVSLAESNFDNFYHTNNNLIMGVFRNTGPKAAGKFKFEAYHVGTTIGSGDIGCYAYDYDNGGVLWYRDRYVMRNISMGGYVLETDLGDFDFYHDLDPTAVPSVKFHDGGDVGIGTGTAVPTARLDLRSAPSGTTSATYCFKSKDGLGNSFFSTRNDRVIVFDEAHLKSSQATAPTCTITGTGTTSAATVAGSSDIRGTITTVAGSPAGTSVVTCTFNRAYSVAPYVFITGANPTGAIQIAGGGYVSAVSTTSFDITFTLPNMHPSFNYFVME